MHKDIQGFFKLDCARNAHFIFSKWSWAASSPTCVVGGKLSVPSWCFAPSRRTTMSRSSCRESIKRSLQSTPVTTTTVQSTTVLCNQDTLQHFWGQESGWEPLRLESSSSGCTTGAPFSGLTIPQRCPRGERRRSPSPGKPTSFCPFAKYWIIFLSLASLLPAKGLCLSFPSTHNVMLSLKWNLPRKVVSRGSGTKTLLRKGNTKTCPPSLNQEWVTPGEQNSNEYHNRFSCIICDTQNT